MSKVTPQEFSEAWANNLSGATQKITRGIQSVSVAPSQQAIAKKAKMIANWQAAVTGGKWERGMAQIDLPTWQRLTMEKGIPRIGQGAQAAKGKVAEFAAKLLPFQDNLKQTVSKMNDVTPEDNINRMVAWVRGMMNFKR